MSIVELGDPAAASLAVEALSAGRVVIVPTDTVYGIAAAISAPIGATDIAARKGRPADKPLAVLVADLEQAEALIVLSDTGRDLATKHWPGPLTLVGSRTESARHLDLGHADSTIGVRCPDHPWLLAVIAEVGPLIATSANRAGEQPAVSAAECREIFGDELLIVDDGRKEGAPSAVVQVDPFVILRPGGLFPDAAENA